MIDNRSPMESWSFRMNENWLITFGCDWDVSCLAGTLGWVITNVPTSCLDIPTRCNTPEGLVHTKHTSTPLRYSRRKEAALSSKIIIGEVRRGEAKRRAWSIRTDESVASARYTPPYDFEHCRSVFSTLFENRIGVHGGRQKKRGRGERGGLEKSGGVVLLNTPTPLPRTIPPHRAPLAFFALIKSSCLRAASSTAILARGTPPLLCFRIFLMISPLQTRILLSFSSQCSPLCSRSPPPPPEPLSFPPLLPFSRSFSLRVLLYLCNLPNSPLVTTFHHHHPFPLPSSFLACTVHRASCILLLSLCFCFEIYPLPVAPFSMHYCICVDVHVHARINACRCTWHVALTGPREHRVQMRVSRVNTRVNRTASPSCSREGCTIIPIRSNRETGVEARQLIGGPRARELTSNRVGNTEAGERRREKEREREEEKDQHTRAMVFEIVHDRAAPSRTQALLAFSAFSFLPPVRGVRLRSLHVGFAFSFSRSPRFLLASPFYLSSFLGCWLQRAGGNGGTSIDA